MTHAGGRVGHMMSLGCSDGQENNWILRGNNDGITSPPGFIWISSSPPPRSLPVPPPFSSLAFVLCLARGRAYLMHVSLDPPHLSYIYPPPCHCIIPLWPVSSPFLCTLPLSCLILHSSVLNALPLSTLEPERSSLLRRRRGIWIRSNICGPRALPQLRESSESQSGVDLPALRNTRNGSGIASWKYGASYWQ